MQTKKCTKCNTIKPLAKFNKNKNLKDGLRSNCKSCDKISSRNYHHSLKGLLTIIFYNQKQSTKRKNFIPIEYTKSEFVEFFINNKKYIELYQNWIESSFDKMQVPSFDRLNDYKGYSFDNLQVVTWGENNNKRHSDVKNGINNKQNKAVLQFTKNNVFVKGYYSISQAWRETDTYPSNIICCCKSERKTAGGFRWEYKMINYNEKKLKERKQNDNL